VRIKPYQVSKRKATEEAAFRKVMLQYDVFVDGDEYIDEDHGDG